MAKLRARKTRAAEVAESAALVIGVPNLAVPWSDANSSAWRPRVLLEAAISSRPDKGDVTAGPRICRVNGFAEPRAVEPPDLEPGAPDRRDFYAKLERSRQDPVQWLSPKELARTGIKAAQATMFGEFADKREVEAGLPAELYDFSNPGAAEFWLDYAADVGDGFNATYAVASQLASPQLVLPGENGSVTTERGRLLVLGGDEVYPVGSATNYTARTTGPYRAALPLRSADSPAVLAVPGNHDWYDGLSAFLRVFCQSWLQDPPPTGSQDIKLRRIVQQDRDSDFMGGWRTLQSRSYFAARLPHDWWLWGIDIQFDTFIDAPQLSYFVEAAKLVGNGNIILCTAKPSWVDFKEAPESYEILSWFIRRVLGDDIAAVRLILSGDTHHYARFELRTDDVEAPAHLITCGGGGAYLSETHQLPPTLSLTADFEPADGEGAPHITYERQETYPTEDDSKAIAYRQFWTIPHRNWSLGILIGILHALFVLLVAVAQEPVGDRFTDRLQAFDPLDLRWAPPLLPALALGLLVVVATIGLAMPEQGQPRRRRKTIIGAVHGLAHLALALAIGAAVAAVPTDQDAWYAVVFSAAVAVLGGVAGSHFAALYFLFASRLAQVNTNELYAGMQIQDRKSFLRIRITADALTVFPVKLHEVPRAWKFNASGGPADPLFIPDGEPVRAALIRDPITISPRSPSARSQSR